MKKSKQSSMDVDATRENSPRENEKLRRDQESRKKGLGLQNDLPEQNASGLNEKEGEDEMEHLYRDEEGRGASEGA